ncbi:MAG: hypothetical protein WDZ82_02140 [Candidatus Paceibacterota bacterium]
MKYIPLAFFIVVTAAVVFGVFYISFGSITNVSSELTGEDASEDDIEAALSLADGDADDGADDEEGDDNKEDEIVEIGCSFTDEVGTSGFLYARSASNQDGDVRVVATTTAEHDDLPDRQVHLLVIADTGWIWLSGEREGEEFVLAKSEREETDEEVDEESESGEEDELGIDVEQNSVTTTATTSTTTATTTDTVTEGSDADESIDFDIFDTERLSRERIRTQLVNGSSTCYTMSLAESLFEKPVLVEFDE